MLAAILKRHAQPRGLLFDLPHVVANAAALLSSNGVLERVSIEAGDFFKEVPAGGDVYVLSHIIHDWSEEQCMTILGHCRKAMGPQAVCCWWRWFCPRATSRILARCSTW